MKKLSVLLAAALILCLAFGACAETLAGGWQLTEDPAVTEEAAAAFETAMDGWVGVSYTPVALLATQVVAGVNYCLLCTSTTVTAQPVQGYALVYIYAALDGSAEVLDITALDGETIGVLRGE